MLDQTFAWQKSYELGIPELDQQHRFLLRLIQRFAEAEEFSVQKELLEIFTEFLLLHMESEEGQMDFYGFPKKHKHYKQHVQGVQWINELSAEFNKEALSGRKCAMELLKWFLQHSTADDRELYDYINQNTAKAAAP